MINSMKAAAIIKSCKAFLPLAKIGSVAKFVVSADLEHPAMVPPPGRTGYYERLSAPESIDFAALHPRRSKGRDKLPPFTSLQMLVPKKGLEPSHPCEYVDLNHARLPIPPLRHKRHSSSGGGRLSRLSIPKAA